MEFETVTIEGVRAGVASGAATATSVAQSYYARIAAEDGPDGKCINSYLALSKERALAQAAKIDGLAAKGEALPVLAGVPVGVKDVLTMTGSPATAGSLILKGYMPPYDATAVRRLEEAGAVLLGKLNCDEFAMGSSNENSAYGPVRNPRALDRVPGDRAADRRRRLRQALPWRRSARIRVGRSGSRQRFVASAVSCRRMGGCRGMG